MQLFIEIAREYYGINHIRRKDIVVYQLDKCLDMEPEVITAVIERILSGNYELSLKPIAGARKVLRKINQRYPLLMVTARPNVGPMHDWMKYLLNGSRFPFKIIAVGSHEAKAEVLRQAGITHFVEDRLDTCHLLYREGIVPILFNQPWNRQPHPFIEVEGWDQLEALLSWQ